MAKNKLYLFEASLSAIFIAAPDGEAGLKIFFAKAVMEFPKVRKRLTKLS